MLDLPENLAKIAFEEYGETPELRVEKLNELRGMISSSFVPEESRIKDTSDENLIRFLRGRKFNVEKACETTVKYAEFIRKHPQWTTNLTAREFRDFSEVYQVLEKPDSRGRLIVIQANKNGLDVYNTDIVRDHPLTPIRSNMWLLENVSRNVHAQVCGIVVLQYFSGMTLWDNLSFSRHVSVSEQLGKIHFAQQCIGIRVKTVLVVDPPTVARYIISLIRPLVSKKISDRINFCDGSEDYLSKYFEDTSMIPTRFGGTLEDDGGYRFVLEHIKKEEESA